MIITLLFQEWARNRSENFSLPDLRVWAHDQLHQQEESKRITMVVDDKVEWRYCILPEDVMFEQRVKIWQF